MKFLSLTIFNLFTILITVLLSAETGWSLMARQGDVGRGPDRFKNRDYVFDKRHNHNRRYPKPGLRVRRLPPGVRYTPYRRRHYYYYGGVWYRPIREGYTVIRPPVGLTVTVLPPYYTTIWVGDVPYYYADGVYYVWHANSRIYVVSEPPPGDEVEEQASQPKRLFIYPKEGQSEEQQANDRYECHSWSMKQTGFDPTRPGGDVPEEQYSEKREEYQRAMKACLEARNYSVQ